MSMGNAVGQTRRVLILGGTGDARALAARLVAAGHEVTSSLAGRTQAPLLPQGAVRIGGFGGAEGLASYLSDNAIDMLVDATHPFAATISANAVHAATRAQVPLLRLERPLWTRPDGAVWIGAADMDQAAAALPVGARVLLTIGRQELAPFFPRTGCTIFARMIEVPPDLPPGWTIIAERGPFTVPDEIALLRRHAITHLVSKNSGGDQAAAKLEAAAHLSIPVIMVARPLLPPAPTVASVAEVCESIARIFRTG